MRAALEAIFLLFATLPLIMTMIIAVWILTILASP